MLPNYEVTKVPASSRCFSPNATLLFSPKTTALSMSHYLINLRLGRRFHLAPISKSVQRVLDIGTGAGIWRIDMGMCGFPL